MKIGLALEGGGMRGVFTTGVLDVFLENNIEFDSVIGVSAGACHACSFLSRQAGRGFRVCANYVRDKNYCGLYSLIKTGDIFGAEMIYHTIPEKLDPIDNEAFLKGKTSFRAVVTNCETGKAEYPCISDMFNDVDYIRASSSMPGVSRIVEINGKKYLDGGVTDSIPLKRLIELGNQKNTVILTQPRNYVKGENRLMPFLRLKYKDYPQLVNAMQNRHKVYNETRDFIFKREKQGEVFIFEPPEKLDLSKVEKNPDKLFAAYTMGRKEAERRLSEFVDFLA